MAKNIEYALFNPKPGDRRFMETPQTVFLATDCNLVERRGVNMVPGAAYVYSDKLPGGRLGERAWRAASAKFTERRSAAFYQEYLRIILKKPTLKLVHIVAGLYCNEPYRVYGYQTR